MKMFYEIPTTNLSPEQMMEKLQIKELVEYERYCCDYNLKEEQKKLWFQDGTIFTTWFKGSFEDYIKASPVHRDDSLPGHDETKPSANHRINNTVVWLNGERAVAELVCFLDFRAKLGFEWIDLRCWCRMHYRLEKREGKWGIVYFEGIYEKDRMDPVFNDSTYNVPQSFMEKYRPNSRCMAFRRDVFEGGLNNYAEWAGPDRPETIRRLYEESSAWLTETIK